MAVVSTFSPTTGVLSTFGDNLTNNITLSRNAAGNLLVNGGAVPILGGQPTVANTDLMQVFGQTGDDVITLNEVNGALPSANLFGGTGNDTLIGGSSRDMLFGQSGNDTLFGRGGIDFLFGGTEDDILTGGDGDDQVFGEAGNDRMIWNVGDDTDLFEGGSGIDTAEINAGNGAEQFTVTANGTRVRADRLDPAPFALDLGTTENLVVNLNGGNDTFSATGNLAALIKLTIDGGAGNDTILGSNGIDTLIGGSGKDLVDGQQGNDVAFMGSGNDTFQWDPGDGSDVVEGGTGTDTLLFNGSAGSESFTVSANGERVQFTRNLGNIVMDLDDVETIQLNAMAGTDTIVVNDLTGTDVSNVKVNLQAPIGGGDDQADVVIANGTDANDSIKITGSGTLAKVSGLAAKLEISGTEGANDSLVINALGGNDTISASTVPAGVMKLTLDGGAGDDVLRGSQGADVFLGGAGNDYVFGDNGNDLALLGAGDDVFEWQPGDGSDTIEGQDGMDALSFFGSAVSENINIFANGGRVGLFRDVANVTMDLNDVESIDLRMLGGSDNVVIGDLSGTDVTEVNVDLRGPSGGPDGAIDTVTVNATQGDDVFGVTGDIGGVQVFGLQAMTNMFFTDADDRLTLNGLGGDDVIDATSLEASAVQLTMNGGLGDDVLLGSEGDDLINGGDGTDLALMGAGDDTFVWNPGDDNDTLEGQAGFDTLRFNGSNASENVTLSAIDGRIQFFRDVASVDMDLNDVEAVEFNAGGGTDNIVVNDTSGTDVVEVKIDLAGTVGGSTADGVADTITIFGTEDDDVILLTTDNGMLVVNGLATQISVEHFDANDTIRIIGLGGDDVIEASGVETAGLQLFLDGGNGDDVIIGGVGNDVLVGGEGDDVLLGGLGIDVIDGQIGDDIEIQLVSTPSRQDDFFVI
jgi:Ca2+-binding RTX toxin-like protein